MKKGTRVIWTTASEVHGSGTVIADELEGHVPVAVDGDAGEERRMIWCAVTWLTAVRGITAIS